MSLMQNHIQRMGKNWLTANMSIPYVTGNFTAVVTSITVTPAVAPAAGDMLVFHLVQTTSIISGSVGVPSGWLPLQIATTTNPGNCAWYKIATASEPASYTFTVASGAYAWNYIALRGVQEPLIMALPIGGASYPGSYTTSPFTIPWPCIAISFLGKTTTTAWDPSVGWTLVSFSGQNKAAYRIYTGNAGSDTVTWAISPPGSTATNIQHFLVVFTCKNIKH